jgi:hypothetical protein
MHSPTTDSKLLVPYGAAHLGVVSVDVLPETDEALVIYTGAYSQGQRADQVP